MNNNLKKMNEKKISNNINPKNMNIIWEFEEGGNWRMYDPNSSNIIERFYRKKEKECVLYLNFQYRIKFHPKWHQINITTGRIRKIRRRLNSPPKIVKNYINIDDIHQCSYFNNIDLLSKYIISTNESVSGSCSICLCDLNSEEKIKLDKCNHIFHSICFFQYLKTVYNEIYLGFSCPICRQVYGVIIGDQPSGIMNIVRSDMILPSYNCTTIIIYYHIPDGTYHNKTYSGTYRRSYLPDNKQGNKILRLLEEAFYRKLTFTIGTSVTNQIDNTTIWNGIHHKTKISGGPSNYGYPDGGYFNRVEIELEAVGVTIESIKEFSVVKYSYSNYIIF